MLQLKPLVVDAFTLGITDNFVAGDPRSCEVLHNWTIINDGKPAIREGMVLDTSSTNPDLIFVNSAANTEILGMLTPLGSDTRVYRLAKSSTYIDAYFAGASSFTKITPSSSHLFSSVQANDLPNSFTWNSHHIMAMDTVLSTTTGLRHRPQMMYRGIPQVISGTTYVGVSGATESLRIINAGLPAVASSIAVTGTSAPTDNYIFGFCYKYAYKIGDRLFEMRGPIRQVQVALSGTVTVTIPAFPILDDNFDLSSPDANNTPMRLEIYRTSKNGSVLRFVKEVPYNTSPSTTVDLTATLSSATAYITGGVYDNDPPPKCKFCHITEQGTAYYGYYIDEFESLQGGTQSVVVANGFIQSKPTNPLFVPADFSGSVDGEITGISSFKEVPLIFTADKVYRVAGKLDDQGQGQLIPKIISNDTGCISHHSIVKTTAGVFFPGKGGFYFSDGYTVRKISEHLSTETYPKYFSDASLNRKVKGIHDTLGNRILWAVRDADSGADAYDIVFVLHLNFGIGATSCFTTWGSDQGNLLGADPVQGNVSRYFTIRSLIEHNNEVLRGDSYGTVAAFRRGAHTDARILGASATWTSAAVPIMYNFTTAAMHFGVTTRKWTPKYTFYLRTNGEYASSQLSIAFYTQRDMKPSKSILEGKPIIRKAVTWGDPAYVWGSIQLWSESSGIASVMRRNPSPGHRCTYRQIILRNAFAQVLNSDQRGGAAALSGTTMTLPSPYEFPSNVVDYYVYFDKDNYATGYRIIERTSDTSVTLGGTPYASPSNAKWIMKGYLKGDSVHIMSMTAWHDFIGTGENPYRSGEEGGNP